MADVEREMHDAIRFHLDGLREDGIAAPEPTSVVPYADAWSRRFEPDAWREEPGRLTFSFQAPGGFAVEVDTVLAGSSGAMREPPSAR